MRHRVFNEDGNEELVFVMGWGNRWTHENVSWLIGKLTEAGYRVHAFELPTTIEDFKADWLEPVAEYVLDLEEYQLLGHSAGALVAQALDGADNHVYLSPWWGTATTTRIGCSRPSPPCRRRSRVSRSARWTSTRSVSWRPTTRSRRRRGGSRPRSSVRPATPSENCSPSITTPSSSVRFGTR
ncbi:alpha/beta hydrolase [Natrialba swarupiae]|nr:alpha/beta hydrolase [Natrialba swarupiae]